MKSGKNTSSKNNNHNNNFDLLRLLAAFFVLISHSFGILDKGLQQPGLWYNGNFIILSHIGLYTFFTISGYLVTQSFFNSNNYPHYLWKRFVRILPALAVVNFFCIIMGCFITTLPVKAYLSDKATWSYFFKNTTLLVNQFTLPGVFSTLHDNSVNASLWTISVEVKFYIALLLAGVLSVLNRKWLLLSFFILFEALRIYMNLSHKTALKSHDLEVYFTFGTFFYLGTLFYCFKDDIPLKWFYVNILLAIVFLTVNTIIQDLSEAAFLSYCVLILVRSRRLINLKGIDLSYGFYLYAFPVQQLLLLYFGCSVNVWLHIALSTFISLVMAAMSWFLVEQPTLNKKNAFVKIEKKLI